MARQAASVVSTGSTGSASGSNEDVGTTTSRPAKKPYVRLITDKRREQNRRAQKVYRERLKKRLENLEEQAAATTGNVSVLATPSRLGLDENGGSEEEPSTSNLSLVDTVPASDTAVRVDRTGTRIINLADAFLAAGDLPISQGPFNEAIRFDVAPSPPLQEPECEHVHDDYGDIDLRPIWALPPRTRDKPYMPRSSRISHSNAIMTLTPQRTPGSSTSSSHLSLADPYANHLRLAGINSVEASIAVAIHLRIGRSAYINDHPSHFPGCYVALNDDSKSPRTINYSFFSTHLTVTPMLSEHMDALKDPLKPSPSQLMNPHPCYLDCIVFPHFRDHAVQASAQGILDHEQLFMDILYGGLVCWGGVADCSSSKRSHKRRRQMQDSVAWSTRSWEAKRWFLKKWSWLIGTEEEEEQRGDVHGIWKGSRWWWNMRGDADSDDDNSEDGDLGDDGEDPQIIENLRTTGRIGEVQGLCSKASD